MPLDYEHRPWGLPSFVIVWAVTESASFFEAELPLSEREREHLIRRYANAKARLDWMASRYALQRLCGQHCSVFYKDAAGKLRVPNTPLYFSISHSGGFVAALQGPTSVGIDVQVPTPKLARIAHKYIAPEVLAAIQNHPQYTDYLHYYWGIKEALFKAYGKGQLNYIQHLYLLPFEAASSGQTLAIVQKNQERLCYRVFYKKTPNYYLCGVITDD